MRKCIVADNCLVGLDDDTGKGRDHPAGIVQLFSDNTGIKVVQVTPDFQCHDNLFKRSISCTLSDAVDGALNLPCTMFQRAETVCHGKAKVVMAVHADDGFSDIRHAAVKIGYFYAELRRPGITGRVRDIDGRCSSFNNSFNDFSQIALIRTTCIFSGKLNIRRERSGKGYSIDSHVQNCLSLLLQTGSVTVTAEFPCNMDAEELSMQQ